MAPPPPPPFPAPLPSSPSSRLRCCGVRPGNGSYRRAVPFRSVPFRPVPSRPVPSRQEAPRGVRRAEPVANSAAPRSRAEGLLPHPLPASAPWSRAVASRHVTSRHVVVVVVVVAAAAMAAAAGEPGAGGAAEEAFLTFYSEVKQIEKRDSVLTSKNQIDRLTRPGSSYFNLNPFEVLQMDPEATDEEIKKRFRQLSILVHPDKNQDDADRAQKAFEAVDKAYKLLLDQEQKKRALDVIQAGKEYVEHTVKEKKKQLKKDGKPATVEEDDPEVFKQAVYKQTMKLFAELEIKRKEREAKEMHERKRQREEEIEAQEKAKREREWQKNFEESRDGRVDSWRNFQANTKGKKEKKNRTFLRPPKVKMEQRE